MLASQAAHKFTSEVHSFIERWQASGASERANYALFLTELCDLIGVEHPDPASAQADRNAYTFERSVRFDDGKEKTSTGRIDLYKRGCFVLEAKQGSDTPEETEAERLGLEAPRRKTGTARRETRAWERAMERAKNQALRYVRALPDAEEVPPLVIVTDVGYCFDIHAGFDGSSGIYVFILIL